MRRQALALMMPLMLSIVTTGCMSMDGSGPNSQQQLGDNPGNPGCQGTFGRTMGPPRVNVLQGPDGAGVPLSGVWAASPPGNNYIARQMLRDNVDPKELDIYYPKTLDAMNSALAQSAPGLGTMPTRFYPQNGLIAPKGWPLMPGMSPPTGVMQAGYNSGPAPQQNNYRGYYGYNYPSNYSYPYGYSYPYYGYPYYGYNNSYNNSGDARGSNGEVIHAEIRTDGSGDGSVRQAQFQPGGGGMGGGGMGGPPAFGQPYGVGMNAGVGGGWGYPINMGMGGMGGMGGYPINLGAANQSNCGPGGTGGQRIQIKFTKPSGMQVYWYGIGPNGSPMFSKDPLFVPGRYNFIQGAMYRLKITNILIGDQPILDLYPTLEVMPPSARTQEFLSHSSVPLAFTDDDFRQIEKSNYLVKVIYLPDPKYQDQATNVVDEIVSTTLDPGMDPVKEAQKRGSVLLVIRMGNVEQELSHTPPLNSGSSSASQPGGMACPPGGAGVCPPGGGPCPPGAGGGACPPGQWAPGRSMPGGAGYGPGMGGYSGPMPPAYSLGGADQPGILNQRPLPQLPYMYWPYGPFANGPWAWQSQYPQGMQQQCQPGYGAASMQQYPQQPQGYPQGMMPSQGMQYQGFNPTQLPPGITPLPGPETAKGIPTKKTPNTFVDRDVPPLTPPSFDDKKPANSDMPSTAANPPAAPGGAGATTSSTSMSPPTPPILPDLTPAAPVDLVKPPSTGDTTTPLPSAPGMSPPTGSTVTPSGSTAVQLFLPPSIPGTSDPAKPSPASSAVPSFTPPPTPPVLSGQAVVPVAPDTQGETQLVPPPGGSVGASSPPAPGPLPNVAPGGQAAPPLPMPGPAPGASPPPVVGTPTSFEPQMLPPVAGQASVEQQLTAQPGLNGIPLPMPSPSASPPFPSGASAPRSVPAGPVQNGANPVPPAQD
jgi:hypothetical protein